jgi:hypothetical protein
MRKTESSSLYIVQSPSVDSHQRKLQKPHRNIKDNKKTFVVVLVIFFLGLAVRYPVGRGGLIDLSVGGQLYNA